MCSVARLPLPRAQLHASRWRPRFLRMTFASQVPIWSRSACAHAIRSLVESLYWKPFAQFDDSNQGASSQPIRGTLCQRQTSGNRLCLSLFSSHHSYPGLCLISPCRRLQRPSTCQFTMWRQRYAVSSSDVRSKLRCFFIHLYPCMAVALSAAVNIWEQVAARIDSVDKLLVADDTDCRSKTLRDVAAAAAARVRIARGKVVTANIARVCQLQTPR